MTDSQAVPAGAIPGPPADAAFTLTGPQPSAIPVLIAVPHAGRAYDADLLGRLRDPAAAMLRLEDRHADRLAGAVAERTGAMLLIARAPRALIDLNRAPDDIDPAMLPRADRAADGGPRPTHRARGGLGLFPRRVPGMGELWRAFLHPGEAGQRIRAIHQPYHACLAASLEGLRARWGAALLLDLHSMPPLPAGTGGPAAQFVVGDRFGASCHGRIAAEMFDCLGRWRRPAAHNRPYAGGYVLDRHAAPHRGIHAVQLEIDRAAYLDSALDQPGEGMAGTVDVLADLVRRLGALVAGMGAPDATEGLPQAAE